MSDATGRIRRCREAKKQLADVWEKRNRALVIHYSCESFYNRGEAESPRITSIAVRNLATAQTKSFSIHQLAERDGRVSREDVDDNYDRLEKRMLGEFFNYAKSREDCIWLHWNMRDASYGFEALEHRFKIHGEKPFVIPEPLRFDLARVLIELYGVNYIGHPRLEMLAEKNDISTRDFLNGEKEARAFENGKYVALHRSTLRKVDIISDIASRAVDDTLATDAKRKEIYGSYLVWLTEKWKEHPLYIILCAIAAIVSIAVAIASVFSFLWS